MNAPQTEEEKHQQQQAKARLRQQCSVGHQPGHFGLVSERWGSGLQLLQGQRNKRKAAQAFDTAATPGEPTFPGSANFDAVRKLCTASCKQNACDDACNMYISSFHMQLWRSLVSQWDDSLGTVSGWQAKGATYLKASLSDTLDDCLGSCQHRNECAMLSLVGVCFLPALSQHRRNVHAAQSCHSPGLSGLIVCCYPCALCNE